MSRKQHKNSGCTQQNRTMPPDSRKKVLLTASVASMLDLFNRENIRILLECGCQVEVAANFSFGNITSRKRVEDDSTGDCRISRPDSKACDRFS